LAYRYLDKEKILGNKFISFNAGAPASPKAPPMAPVDQDPGASARKAGSAIIAFSEKLKERDEQSAALTREETIVEDKLFIAKRYQELIDILPNGGEGIFDILQKELQARSEKQSGLQTTDKAKRVYGLQSKELLGRTLAKAIGTEAQASALGERRSHEKVRSSNLNTVLKDPTKENLQDGIEQLRRMSENSRASRKLKDKFNREDEQDMYAYYVQGLMSPERIQSSQEANVVLSELQKADIQKVLDPKIYKSLLGQAEKLVEHHLDKEEAVFIKDARGLIAEIKSGVSDVDLTVKDLSIVRDATERKLLIEDFEAAKLVGAERQFIEAATPAEIRQRLAELKYLVETAGTGKYPIEAARLLAHKTADNERIKAITTDRVAYAMKNTAVQGAHEIYKAAQEKSINSNNPVYVSNTKAALDNYVAAIEAENKRIGVTVTYLLTNPESLEIKTRIGAVQRTPEGASELVSMLDAQARKWGEHWPTVYNQLVEQKTIDGEHIILARIAGDPNRRAEALDFANALSLSHTQLLAGIEQGPNFKKTIKEDIQSRAKDLYRSLAWQGAQSSIRLHQEAMETLTYYYIGRNVSNPIEKAFNALAGDFTFHGSYRVPKDVDGAGVEKGALAIRQNDLTKLPLVLPFSLTGSASITQEQYAGSLKANGRWVTAANQDGLVLVDEHGRAVMQYDEKVDEEDTTEAVIPVFRSWKQLMDRSYIAPRMTGRGRPKR
jgi:hypothetical protein